MLKQLVPVFLLCCFFTKSHAQVSPTLAVGLEELTMNKGTIDVKVLTEIIMEKQKELKKEALKRFMFHLFPQENYTTKFFIQNCLHILLNEKNPQVIEKEIMELTTNYALALGIAQVYYKYENIKDTETTIKTYFDNVAAFTREKDIASLLEKSEEKDKTKAQAAAEADVPQNTIRFSLMVDVTARALSESPGIKKMGFFNNAIDYTDEENYPGKDVALGADLDTLKNTIRNRVESYIENYGVIKEFYMRNKNIDSKTIVATLLANYTADILKIINEDELISKINIIAANSPDTFKKTARDFTDMTVQYNHEKLLFDNARKLYDMRSKLVPDFSNRAVKLKELLYAGLMIPADRPLPIPDLETAVNALPEGSEGKQHLMDSLETLKAISAYEQQLLQNAEVITYLQAINTANVARNPDDIIASFTTDTANETNYNRGMNSLKSDIDLKIKSIVVQKEFLKGLFSDLVTTILSNELDLGLTMVNEQQLKTISEYAEVLSEVYKKLDKIARQDNISLADAQYFEQELIPILLKYSLMTNDATAKKKIQNAIARFRLLSGMLKINSVLDAAKKIGNYKPEFNDVLTFISNLDKLDKAQTYQSIINMIRDNNENIEGCIQNERFRKMYLVFINAVKKYTVINPGQQYISIDVVSFLNDLQEFYGRTNQSPFALYLTLGLSENFFAHNALLEGDTKTISSIGFASEKIGLKFRLFQVGNIVKRKNVHVLREDVYLNRRNPFINEVYMVTYGSGLLYSVANTTTNENFDYPHAGMGLGVRFFNALDFNISLAVPFIDGQRFSMDDRFISVGFDIPLGQYLERLGKK